jgi:hypothetical protein
MARVRGAWLVVVAFGFIVAWCQAVEAQNAAMKVVSSDATDARTVQIGVNKSVVIEFARDVAKVVVGGTGSQQSGNHPDIVTLVPLTGRRFSIIGLALGTTNAFFYDAADRQVGALVVWVTNIGQLPPPLLENSDTGGNVIQIYRGNSGELGRVARDYVICDVYDCGIRPERDEPASTTHSDITINGGAQPVVPVR